MGVLTLLSDLGLQDASVAVAKGILMRYPHGHNIIDITHDIMPFNTRQAAYLLGSAYRNFPEGTWHILLFDLFADQYPALLLCEHEGHYFFTADNGMLPLALGAVPANVRQCTALKKGGNFNDWLHAIGYTVNSLSANKASINELPTHTPRVIAEKSKASPTGIIECEVIHIDQYENVVMDMTRQQMAKISNGRQFRLQFMRVEEINEISAGYADVRPGYKLCRYNSNGHLEICINRGKAASLFGLRMGSRHNDIKIFFE